MSRQFVFYHTEQDALRLLQLAESKGGLIFENEKPLLGCAVPGSLHKRMNTFSCKFHLFPSSLAKQLGTAPSKYEMIEFMNCTRGDNNSQSHEIGRLYLAPMRDGSYAAETTKLYEAIRRYIKANYRYAKHAGVYISPEFLEKALSHEVSAVWAKRSVSIELSSDGSPQLIFGTVNPVKNPYSYF